MTNHKQAKKNGVKREGRGETKQVRIHESTVACDWAGAVMPENHEKNEILDILDIFEN